MKMWHDVWCNMWLLIEFSLVVLNVLLLRNKDWSRNFGWPILNRCSSKTWRTNDFDCVKVPCSLQTHHWLHVSCYMFFYFFELWSKNSSCMKFIRNHRNNVMMGSCGPQQPFYSSLYEIHTVTCLVLSEIWA